VLQLVDPIKNRVIELQKVNSIEYKLFSQMNTVLMEAIERGELDTQHDKCILVYGKEHRALCKGELPHPESFYSEVFS